MKINVWVSLPAIGPGHKCENIGAGVEYHPEYQEMLDAVDIPRPADTAFADDRSTPLLERTLHYLMEHIQSLELALRVASARADGRGMPTAPENLLGYLKKWASLYHAVIALRRRNVDATLFGMDTE